MSLRYFALKRGIEDFELIALVAAKPDGQQVLEQVWKAVIRQMDIRQWEYSLGADTSGMYSSDWKDYEQARLLLLKALEAK